MTWRSWPCSSEIRVWGRSERFSLRERERDRNNEKGLVVLSQRERERERERGYSLYNIIILLIWKNSRK
jgi:hypothetical protein